MNKTMFYATLACASALAPDFADANTLMPVAGGKPGRDEYVRAWGVRARDFGLRFASDGEVAVALAESSAPCNMLYPGETLAVKMQVRNASKAPLEFKGKWILLEYSLRTNGGDVFDLSIVEGRETVVEEGEFFIAAGAVAECALAPAMPESFGAAALLFERGDTGTRLFAGSFARIIEPALEGGAQFYQICMDSTEPAVVSRLHTAPNRIGVAFVPEDDPECEKFYAKIEAELEAIRATGYPVCVEFGAGPERGAYLPLGRTRPHLTADGVMMETKSDYAWLPEYDAQFARRVKRLVAKFGYPRGPVNALMLWNEPWNGLSISGWGADELRYREIYTAMCEAADEAMAEDPELRVLLGGCDSSSNTFDKLFPDGDERFLKWLDFLSLHYQGLSPSNARFMRDREHKNGRTMFWDTESWVANSQDRVPGVLAGMLAAGHDRLVGIQGHGVVATSYDALVAMPNGRNDRIRQFNAWPVAPALAAFQHFIGNRKFTRLAWDGLPWVFEFRGEGADDTAFVVCGDISPVFDGKGRGGIVPFRTARGAEPLNGSLVISDAAAFSLYDGNGNRVAGGAETLAVPLTDASYYLVADGSEGSGARLAAAIAAARIEGVPPVAPALKDAVKPIGRGAVFTAVLKNVLNREIKGAFSAEAQGLSLEYDKQVAIAPNASVEVPLRVVSDSANPDNSYFFRVVFDAGADGKVELNEVMHCNVITDFGAEIFNTETQRHGDTENAINSSSSSSSSVSLRPCVSVLNKFPQHIADGGSGVTMMEKAWLPMEFQGKDDEPAKPAAGASKIWLGACDEGFLFRAEIPDTTPDAGMMRFETRDEDADFYPAETREYNKEKTIKTVPSRDGKSWSPLVDKMAFEFTPSPPSADGTAVLSIHFKDDDNGLRRHYNITGTDAVTGKRVFREEFRPMQDSAWWSADIATDAISGISADAKIRVEIQTRNWLKPLVAAIKINGEIFEYADESAAAANTAAPAFAWVDEVSQITHVWPEGVRRFSYRRRPELPQGATPARDNVQIAFNVLPDEAKPWHPAPPGVFKGYAEYWDTDYEFALNPVAEEFGGGVEVWRLRAPELPNKHYYPRAPKHPLEGAAKNARLEITREDGIRKVAALIPWEYIPEVKAARDAGRPIKFTCRVNDNGAPSACVELACGRSISKRNGAFKPDWTEHWANEIVFGWLGAEGAAESAGGGEGE